MKTISILLDGGFVLRRLYSLLGKRYPTAADIVAFARQCVSKDEELFRIYFYHCPPFAGIKRHPLLRTEINFSRTRTYAASERLLQELSRYDYVALRLGELSFDGWVLNSRATTEIIRTGRSLLPTDLGPDLKQKRADIKIGLDVAWLASKRLVDRIALVTGDSDFVPAMKFARREGVQIIFIPMAAPSLKSDLYVHADEVRAVPFPV